MTDQAQPGHFYTRLIRGGPKVPVKIWLDGDTTRAVAGGKSGDADKLYPFCTPITEAEYDRMVGYNSTALADINEPLDIGLLRPVTPNMKGK